MDYKETKVKIYVFAYKDIEALNHI